MENTLMATRIIDYKTWLLICILLLPWSLFILVSIGDWAGFALLIGMTFYFFITKEFMKNKKIFFCGLFVLITHQSIALVNAYVGTTLGADADALNFHQEASLLASYGDISIFTNGAGFYKNFLAVFYKLFGSSHLLGMELSVLAFLLSMVVLLKILTLIGQTRHQHTILLMYGLLPTVITLTSVTLRESWQMLFFMMIVYYSIKLRKKKNISSFILLIFSAVGLSFWHNGFLAFLPLLMFVCVLWAFGSKNKKSVVFKGFITMFAIVLIFISLQVIKGTSSSSAANALTSGNPLEYIEQYRSNSDLDSGASYVSEVAFSGGIGVVLNLPIMFFSYMFAPFPWQVRGVMDIYALSESFFRFLLLALSVTAWRKSKGEERAVYGFLIIMFIFMEMLWSLGTSNWGTAMRHHLVAYGVLLSVGGGRFSILLKKAVLFIVK